MRGEQLLHKAINTFEGRRANYGDPNQIFNDVAKRWSRALGKQLSLIHI